MLKILLRVVVFASLFIPLSVSAQEEETKQLEKLQQEIQQSKTREQALKEKAAAVSRQAAKITQQQIALGGEIQATEARLAETARRLQVLEGDIAAKKEDILSQKKTLASTLAALQRLSQRPPEYILMRPAQAVETVRSATLLTSAMPEIERRAEALRRDLEELSTLKAELNSQKSELAAGLSDLQSKNRALEALVREKRALYADYLAGAEQEKQRADRLGREAKSLQNLIERLEQEQKNQARRTLPTPPLPEGSSFQKTKGRMPYPAQGKLTRRFGERITGGAAKGINVQTLSGGQVIAPFDGRIIYAGSFRDYGLLLIIAHSDGYHTLLAGLGRIDGLVGQWVLAGEPVGAMPETRVASTESDSKTPGPELYLEIRRNGEPINPLPWLRK